MINGDSRSPAGTPILALICDGASSPYRLHNLGKQVITTDGVQQQPPTVTDPGGHQHPALTRAERNCPAPPLVPDEEARVKGDKLSLTAHRDNVTLSMWWR